MKRVYLFTLLMALFATTSLFAQSGYDMVIEKTDGNKTYFKQSDIKQVFFEKVEDDSDDDAIENLLLGYDGDFEDGTRGNWGGWSFSGKSSIASPGYRSNYCMEMMTDNPVERPDLAGQIQYHIDPYLETGKTYRIQFYAKANKANTEIAFRYQDTGTYVHQLVKTFTIGKDWTLCRYDFTVPEDYWDVNEITIDFSNEVAVCYVDNIRFGLLKNSGGGTATDAKDKIAGTWVITSCDDPDTPAGIKFVFNNDGTGSSIYGNYSDVFLYTFNSEGHFTKTNANGIASTGDLVIVGDVASGTYSYSGSSTRYSITLKKQSGDDNPTPAPVGAFQGPQRIFGNNRVKAFGREGSDRSEFFYDANGFVSKICMNQYVKDGNNDVGTYEVTFEYNQDGIVAKSWKNGVLFRELPLNIGSNGFLAGIDSGNDNWKYSYNEDDQITDFITSIAYEYDGGGRTICSTKLTWQNGDIVQQNSECSTSVDGVGEIPVEVTNISYATSDMSANGNIAGIMEFARSMNIYDIMRFYGHKDFDLQAIFYYYAGFLGKGTKHLPLAWTESTGYDSCKNTWTLDAAGRAVKLVTEHYYDGRPFTTQTFFVEWEDTGGGNGGTVEKESLVGTWYNIDESNSLGTFNVEIEGYTFNANGTATGFEGKLRESNNYAPTTAEQFSCNYTLSGNSLTIVESDGDSDTYTVSLNNDGTMTLRNKNGKEEYVFTRLPEDKTPYQFYVELSEQYQQR